MMSAPPARIINGDGFDVLQSTSASKRGDCAERERCSPVYQGGQDLTALPDGPRRQAQIRRQPPRRIPRIAEAQPGDCLMQKNLSPAWVATEARAGGDHLGGDHPKHNAPPAATQAQLISAIKAHIAKGDRATEKAGQHYIAA